MLANLRYTQRYPKRCDKGADKLRKECNRRLSLLSIYVIMSNQSNRTLSPYQIAPHPSLHL